MVKKGGDGHERMGRAMCDLWEGYLLPGWVFKRRKRRRGASLLRLRRAGRVTKR